MLRSDQSDSQRERLIGRHNRINVQSGVCRFLTGFGIMVCVTVTLLIVALVLTGQAKTAGQILSSHKSSECPQTLIIAHRGASGLRPAHSTDGYRLAADQGADYIECDVAITKDGVLLCLHEAYLSSVTNIESLPEFENKRRSLDYENKKKLDDWWVTDFTWEELQQLRLIQERSYRDQSFNLKYKIATFAEYLNIAKDKNVGIYPETKTPSWFHEQLPQFKIEDLLIEAIQRSEFNPDRVILQSFSVASLVYMKLELKAPYRMIQLTKVVPTDEQLQELSEKGAYGIGPDKRLIIPDDGTNHRGNTTTLVEDAHSYNLKVHIWTSRNENEFLLFDYGADVHEEYKDLIKAGVDGIFTDFTHSLFSFLSLQEDTCTA